MQFEKVIGDFDPAVVRKAEENLTAVLTELSLRYDNYSIGSGIGGDPLVFNLVYSVQHICTDQLGPGKKLHTAATDGRKYYWNPEFVNKLCEKSKSKIGLRLVVCHEAWHAIYMHPQRRAGRQPKLWNICVDYKVNGTNLEDLKARQVHRDPEKLFRDHLGDFILLEEYADFLRDPFNPPARIAHLNPLKTMYMTPDELKAFDEKHPPMYFADANIPPTMKRPESIYDYLYNLLPRCAECGTVGKYKYPEQLPPEVQERKRTYKERYRKEIEKNLKDQQAKLKEDLKSETDEEKKKAIQDQLKEIEDIFDKLSKKPAPKDDNSQAPGSHTCDSHEHDDSAQPIPMPGNGQPQPGQGDASGNGMPIEGGSDCCGDGCGTCGHGKQKGQGQGQGQGDGDGEGEGDGQDYDFYDPLGMGKTLDDHIDADISEEELGKKIADAIESTKKMAGKVPGGLEDELGLLIAPKLTWQDFVRMVIVRAREGKGRNDWTRPKTRPMFAGLYIPKQKRRFINILVGIDSSGSMSTDDMAFGVSQIQVIDDQGEGIAVPWDTEPYWDAKTPLKKFDSETLAKIKIKGRGGTEVSKLFNEYEDKDKVGPVDLIIIITDSYLYDGELKNAKAPKCPVVWLVTANNDNFNPPFGRVFNLHNN